MTKELKSLMGAPLCDATARERVYDLFNTAYVVQSETGNPIAIDDGADSVPVKELIVNLEPKQSGSGDPSPSNVRPITGYDGVTVKRTGKNLAQSPLATVYSAQNGNYSGENPSYTSSKAEVSPNTEYTLSFGSVGNITAIIYYEELNSNTDFVYVGSAQIGSKNQHTFTTPSNCHFVIVETGGSTSPITPQTVGFIQIEKGSTATDYEPYTEQEYSINFPSSAGTVYGGSLNVTTGVLTVDRGFITLDENVPINLNGRYTESIEWAFTATGKAYGTNNYMSNIFRFESGNAPYTTWGRPSSRIIAFKLPLEADTTELARAWLAENVTTFCYKLETPTTVQLTPIEVTTLLGSNTIQSDGSMDLKYRADISKVIEKLTNAIVSLGGNV